MLPVDRLQPCRFLCVKNDWKKQLPGPFIASMLSRSSPKPQSEASPPSSLWVCSKHRRCRECTSKHKLELHSFSKTTGLCEDFGEGRANEEARAATLNIIGGCKAHGCATKLICSRPVPDHAVDQVLNRCPPTTIDDHTVSHERSRPCKTRFLSLNITEFCFQGAKYNVRVT